MAADILKSLSITNADTFPIIVPNPTGNGANGYAKNITDFCTTTAAGLVQTTSTYKMVRLPSNCKIKSIKLTADAALDTSTGLALDVGAYYSDAPTTGNLDGTPVALAGTSIAVACFSAINVGFRSSALGPIDALGALAVAKRNQPLWQAVGLTSDPGGFIDIVVAVHTAASSAGGGNLGIDVNYVE